MGNEIVKLRWPLNLYLSHIPRYSLSRYSAQHYLQATCQFVVSDCADILSHASDPDTIVDWDVVEQVAIILP